MDDFNEWLAKKFNVEIAPARQQRAFEYEESPHHSGAKRRGCVFLLFSDETLDGLKEKIIAAPDRDKKLEKIIIRRPLEHHRWKDFESNSTKSGYSIRIGFMYDWQHY